MRRRPGAVARAVTAGEDGLLEVLYRLGCDIDDPETPPSARAAAAREYRMLATAIAEAQGRRPTGDDLDDLAARREARLSG